MFATALVATALVALARPAKAIPAFARKYGAACSTCHAGAYPELNPFGRDFKERGYQYPVGSEEVFRETTTIEPGGGGERLLVLRELPLAARLQSAAVMLTAPRETAAGSLDLRAAENLFVLLGGAVGENVSVLAAATVAPAAIHHASIGFHNLAGGDGHLNLRAGRLLLLDFARPEHRALTRLGNPAGTVRIGLNPTALDSTHHGVEFYGRAAARRLFWEVAIVQGAQAPDGLSDLDSNKDVFGQVQVTLAERHTLGALGYLGRTQVTDSTSGVSVRFTDPFWVAGATVQLAAGRFTLHGLAVYGFHENPYGSHEHADYWGARTELHAMLSRRWLAIARYDQVVSHHEAAIETRVATIHAGYSVLGNLRLSLESTADLEHIERSVVSLALDLAL